MRRGRRRRGGAIVALLIVAALLAIGLARDHGPSCHARDPHGAGAAWLEQAIADVPCPGARASYATTDDHHAPMDVLDPIADPRGGYLGVYHTPISRHAFEVLLAHSDDLIHWHRLRVLERDASMPTLRPVPGTHELLLADERSGRHDTIELHLYGSPAALARGAPTRSIDLPLRYSELTNGTPALVQIAWNGSLAKSRIALTFHYGSTRGPDREAFGVLTGFKRWRTRRDTGTDRLLVAEGFPGSHGDQRWFAYAGTTWRILEADAQPGSFAGWHVLLFDPGRGRFAPLAFRTLRGRFSASFGNPTVQVLPAPGGHGQVLAVTLFVFSDGPAAADAGELVYLRRLP